jgi:branched-chain amino acid transport system substrate-binding protein
MKLSHALPAIALSVGLIAPALAQDVPGVTKDTIKIGVIGPMTGSAALFGKSVFGVEALYRDINERGGINGRKIEIIREDDGCDPARGIAAVKKLVSQDRVFAINGIACSGVAMAVKQDISKTDVPLMIMSAASDAISNPTAPNVFQAVATTNVVGRTMIDFAMSKAGTDKIAFVSHSDDWGKSNREPAIAQLKSKYGKESILDLTMERGSNDATPQILKIKNSGAQFVVMMMYPAEVAIFVRDARKYGLKIPMLGPMSISLEDTRDRAGGLAAVENLYVFYPYAAPFASPEMKKWADLITKYFPGERIESFSFLGMGSTLAMIEGLKNAGPELNREKLVAALNGIKNFDTGVISAPVTFSGDDHAGIKGGAMATFKNGQVTVLKSWQ